MAQSARRFGWRVVWLGAAMLLAAPAAAQFGSIFNEPPPRPPANVPNGQQPYYPNQPPPYYSNQPPPNYGNQPPPYYQGEPPRRYEQGQAVRPPVNLHSDVAPTQPMPAPMALPPSSRPGGGTIESKPLAAPPGTTPPPGQAAVPQQPGAPVQTLPGLPPGQRQPRGTPQQQPASTEQGDEVVVEPPPMRIANPTAVFSGLDKITGRITTFDVAINETVQFGALQVTPRVCYSRPPTETPQTDAFVEVDEVTLQGKIQRIFTGWMFAASPGLHAVEHPIYDVWLINCKGGKNPAVAEVPDDVQAKQPPPTPRRPPARAQRR
jgi:hypothetical protein